MANPANYNLKYDHTGLDLTELSEDAGGPHLKAYWDENGKCWTIGYGHTANVHAGDTCTSAQADSYLLSDVATAVGTVKYYVTIALSQEEFDALVDLCFNIGSGNFCRSTLLRCINNRDYKGAIAEFASWDKSGGMVLSGLKSRRAAEAALFALGTDFTMQNPSV